MKLPKTHGQMSDALPTAMLLTFSGGFQDAYSYCVRGKVYANAQTGNIVLMSGHIFAGDWADALRYLIPLLAFACGVFAAEQAKAGSGRLRVVHWRQMILLGEIALLFAVGFLPPQLDFLANALISFSCAMQVQAFRKAKGIPYASTMCIGNLRSGIEALSAWLRTRNPELLPTAGQYFGVIVLFAVGAGVGSVFSARFAQSAIWLPCAVLFAAFTLMFLHEDQA